MTILVVQGEAFHLWVIEAPESVAEEFPANKAGLKRSVRPVGGAIS